MIALTVTAVLSILSAATVVGSRQRILVLHSFHKGQSWNDNLSRGIESVLDRAPVEVGFEYMDTMWYPEEDHVFRLVQFYRYKYGSRPVKVVIATDQRALEFLVQYGPELFPGASVVFCGIKYLDENLLYGVDWVTGVVEPVDIGGSIELALTLNPNLKRLLVLVDNGPISISTIQSFIPVLQAYLGRLSFRFTGLISYEELQRQLGALTDESAVLLVNYTRDSQGRFLTMEESAKLVTAASPVPVYALWDNYLGYGILGGRLVSGFNQGRKAAEIALRIWHGERADRIPVERASDSRTLIDFERLTAFGIPEYRLPPNSLVVNRPHTFYQQYRRLIIGVALGGILALLVILTLSLTIAKGRRMERSLKQTSQRLMFLHQMDQVILNVFSIERVADRILQTISRLFACDWIALVLIREKRQPALLLALTNQGENYRFREKSLPPELDLPDRLIKGDTVQLSGGDVVAAPLLKMMAAPPGLTVCLLSPLIFQGELLGLFLLGDRQRRVFSAESRQSSREVADSLAIAVQNNRLLKESRKNELALRRMSAHILEAQEQERRRISAELHDEFGQTLTAIGFNLRKIRKAVASSGDADSLNRLEETENSLERLSGQVHDLSLDLRPLMLDDMGLGPTLRWYLNQYRERTGLETEYYADEGSDRVIPVSIATAFYRLLQEALTNITKYARASRVVVRLEQTERQLRLTVVDDGVGFDPVVVAAREPGLKGLGLMGMRERVELLGGSFKIQSGKGKGTLLQAVVPLEGEINDEKNTLVAGG